MMRFVCDKCGTTTDGELPAGWSSVQATMNEPGGGPTTTPYSTYHLCEEHGMDVLLGE